MIPNLQTLFVSWDCMWRLTHTISNTNVFGWLHWFNINLNLKFGDIMFLGNKLNLIQKFLWKHERSKSWSTWGKRMECLDNKKPCLYPWHVICFIFVLISPSWKLQFLIITSRVLMPNAYIFPKGRLHRLLKLFLVNIKTTSRYVDVYWSKLLKKVICTPNT